MAFTGTIVKMMISCPGDVEKNDLATVHQAINRWNVSLGEQFGIVVIPVSWNENAVAEFGQPPQDVLNRQLVDRVDLGIAIFWTRLGSATKKAASGTVEEIERLYEAGKPVSVLRCTRSMSVNADFAEAQRLDKYLKEDLYGRALLMGYEDSGSLANQVNSVLSHHASQGVWDVTTPVGARDRGKLSKADVWASVETTQSSETDSKGRVRARTRYKLVLKNRGETPANDVSFVLTESVPGGGVPFILDETNENSPSRKFGRLAPDGVASWRLEAFNATQFSCTIKWVDDLGEEQENSQDLRLA